MSVCTLRVITENKQFVIWVLPLTNVPAYPLIGDLGSLFNGPVAVGEAEIPCNCFSHRLCIAHVSFGILLSPASVLKQPSGAR